MLLAVACAQRGHRQGATNSGPTRRIRFQLAAKFVNDLPRFIGLLCEGLVAGEVRGIGRARNTYWPGQFLTKLVPLRVRHRSRLRGTRRPQRRRREHPRGFLPSHIRGNDNARVARKINDLIPRTRKRTRRRSPATLLTATTLRHKNGKQWNRQQGKNTATGCNSSPRDLQTRIIIRIRTTVRRRRRKICRFFGRLRGLEHLGTRD